MPRFIVAYDVKTPHQGPVKKKLMEYGFADRVRAATGSTRKLPNTTLIVSAPSARVAMDRFRRLADSVALGCVERVLSVPALNWMVHGEAVVPKKKSLSGRPS